MPYDKPLVRTREIITVCRKVWRREHDGAVYQVPLPEGRGTGLGKALKIIVQPVRERIPIYIASLGTKNVEMTAELAEGWLPLHYWPERTGDLWGDALATGTAKRASDLPPLEVVAGGSLAIGNDVEGLRDSPGRRSPSTSAAWVARGSERRARRGDAGVLVATASIDA